jgi:hypothetical protein
MRPRSFALSIGLIAATIAAGLAIRFGRIGLPPFIVKYGGSGLWALVIYWIVSMVLRSGRIWTAVVFSGMLATLVEFLKLYYSPGLDAFRLTLPGILLLGRIFSVWDILAYWAAILAGAALDTWFRRHLAGGN